MDIGFLAGSTFVLIGLFVLIWNEKRRLLADRASNWPVAIGHIVESRVIRARPKTDDDDLLVFLYRYDVDGLRQVSKSIDLFQGEARMTLKEMEQIVQTYPQGAQVEVRYKADDPSVCAIEPDNRLAYVRHRYFAGLVASVGMLMLVALTFAG